MTSRPVRTPPDKFGRDYGELLALQERQLEQLKKLLQPSVFADLERHCQRVNAPVDPAVLEANAHSHTYRAGALHVCPVNSELWDYLMNYGVGTDLILSLFRSVRETKPKRKK